MLTCANFFFNMFNKLPCQKFRIFRLLFNMSDFTGQNEACYKDTLIGGDFMCKYLFLQLYKKSKAKAFK